ncbi:MAG: homocitrate synthase [Candidatus Omnitrophota bacterium]|nr:homocitrate synthase [Candidatus Omnitrophota bacterium]
MIDRREQSVKEAKIVDTTLRDGEQTAGVVFSNEEKRQIANLLDEAGVYQIEAGVPAMKGDEKQAIKDVVKDNHRASILGWCRAVTEDITDAIDCGLDAVCVSIPVSDVHIEKKLNKNRAWVHETVTRAINFAKSHGLYVSCNAEDASRTRMEDLITFVRIAKNAGADRLRFCDTVGILGPSQTAAKIETLLQEVDIPIEVHAHNDFGMATANSIAGFKAGAEFISVTVNGLGERAGNAALEEVVMALKYIENRATSFDISKLKALSDLVAKASGREVPLSKPIVGKNIFTHEAGIQVDGLMKEPATYEVFHPSEIGGERQIMIGKHSGKNAIQMKFKEFGIDLDETLAEKILKIVREKAVELKRHLFDKELMYIYYSETGALKKK